MERYIFKIFILDRTHFTEENSNSDSQVFNTSLFGIRFIIKPILLNQVEVVNQIWVYNYSQRIDFLMPVLLRGSKGIMIIFDCKNPMHLIDDLNNLPQLMTELNQDTTPIFLFGLNALELNDLEHLHLERTIRRLILPIPNTHYINERNIGIQEPYFESVLSIIDKSFIYKEDLHTLIDQGVDNSRLLELHRRNIQENLKEFREQICSIDEFKEQIKHLNLNNINEKVESTKPAREFKPEEMDRLKDSVILFEKQKLDELRSKADAIIENLKKKMKESTK